MSESNTSYATTTPHVIDSGEIKCEGGLIAKKGSRVYVKCLGNSSYSGTIKMFYSNGSFGITPDGWKNNECLIIKNSEISCIELLNPSNYESDDKMVSHPDHYQSKSGLEVIQVVEAFTADLTGIEATDTGNILKYICRWKRKNGKQDLKKAMWYLQHLINHVEKTEKESK